MERINCYNCKNRCYLCHKDCEVYKKYTERLELIKRNKKLYKESNFYKSLIKIK